MKTYKVTKKYILMLLMMLTTIILSGQTLSFKSITVNDGLSQHDVSCILQDSYGFIWIGTYDGLNRYDGYKVENYYSDSDNPNSLSSNRIRSLYEDSNKRIWIGTDGEGLSVFDLKTEKFSRINIPENYRLINHITESETEGILIATSNGVLRINEEKHKLSAELLQIPLTGMYVNRIAVYNSTTYFATNNGLWIMEDGICKQITEVKRNYIEAITVNKEGKVWLGDIDYLACLSKKTDSFYIEEIPLDKRIEIRSLELTEDDNLWIGTIKNGLFKFDAINHKVIEQITAQQNGNRQLLTNSVLSLYCDKSNILWVANRKGVCFTSLSSYKFNKLTYNIDSPTNHIRSLLYRDRGLYIGIQNNGCYYYDLKTDRIKTINLPENLNPHQLKIYNDHIYLISNIGLYKSSKDPYSFKAEPLITKHDSNTSAIVSSMCQDSNGNFYFGTYSGLIIQKDKSTDWIHYLYDQGEILRNKRIFSLLFDENTNCIWAGTISNGIFKINLSKQGKVLSIEEYSTKMYDNYHIKNNTIWCFYKDHDDDIWAGTDAGLLKKDKDSNTFKQVKVKGVVDKKIMAIAEGYPGQLWLSNSQGIIHFTPYNKKVEIYAYNDGLTTSTFTEALDKDENGNIYFGSIEGINYFHPSNIKQSEIPNEAFISGFRVHNRNIEVQKSYMNHELLAKSINATEKIDIHYKHNNFSFEFASTNYISAEENEFRYMLKGYDEEWQYTNGKHRFASYSNLPSGDYTFMVDAANHDGIWSKTPHMINITVYPAPWQTWWAYLIYLLILVSLISLFIYFWHNRQKLQHQIHLDQIHHQKEHEIHELKLRFFTDVAHEFKTPLSLIIGPLNDIMQNNLDIKKLEFNFQVISRNTQRMMFLVSQLLDFRRINADVSILNVGEKDLSEFVHKTAKAFLWQADNENIHFNIITPDKLICYFDPDIIEKVLYNVISNAFKYTPENGVIELELKPIWKNQVQLANIIIRDSGKGIPDEEKNKIFKRYFHGKKRYSSGIGLHLSYTLIKAHKGEINVADSNYGGAEFILSFPIFREAFSDEEINTSKENISQKTDFLDVQSNSKSVKKSEREKILIVEDDHDLRIYLKNCLQSNYLVSEASNGKIGLDTAKKELPDIIISDVMMPEMDGVEMCVKLKESFDTSHIPILLLTAKTDEEYQKQGLDAGAWDYITKPFNTMSLLQKVDNIIETRNKYKEHILNQNIVLDVKKHYTPFDQKFIGKVTEVIEKHLTDSNFNVEELAMEVGLSRMQLHRKIKSLTGKSTTGFMNTIKINHAKNLFDQGCDRIQEAMEAVGINSYSHFNSTFKKVIGKSPSEYIASLSNNLVKETN